MQRFIEGEPLTLRVLQPLAPRQVDEAHLPPFLLTLGGDVDRDQPVASRGLPVHSLLSHPPLLQPDVDDLEGLLDAADPDDGLVLEVGLLGFLG